MTGRHGGHRAWSQLRDWADLLCRNTFAVLGTVLIVGVGLTEELVQALRRTRLPRRRAVWRLHIRRRPKSRPSLPRSRGAAVPHGYTDLPVPGQHHGGTHS